MKFTERNTMALQGLEAIKQYISAVDYQSIKSNIQYLTKPFCDAINVADKKLRNDEFIEHIKNECGVIIKASHTFIYTVSDSKNATVVCLVKNVVAAAFTIKNGKCLVGDGYGYVDTNAKNIWPTSQIVNTMFGTVISSILFIKYCQIESKSIEPGKRLSDFNCKYINDTKHNIKILDSKWFTDLHVSGAFQVRGHFRLQPCGEAFKDRKLVWIKDFEKTGYSRKHTKPDIL